MAGFRDILAPYGLRIRIISLMTLLTVLLVFLIGMVVLKIAERNFLHQKFVSGDLALMSLQSSLDTFWQGRTKLVDQPDDFAKLQKLVVQTSRNLGLLDMSILDRNMRVIVASKRTGVLEEESNRAISDAFKLGTIQRKIYGDPGAFGIGIYERMEFSGPLVIDREIVAVARFSLSLRDVGQSLQGTLRVLYLYTFLNVLLVLFIGGYALLIFIVRPLEELREATERIGMGELSTPIPTFQENEIGRLGRALETLRATLEAKDGVAKREMEAAETLNRQLKQIRDQLIHTDRLAYLGRVTAGVAHEIGNPLGAIFNYLEILRNSLDDKVMSTEIVERIESEIERIDSIMKEMLSFSRSTPEGKMPLDMRETVEECVRNLKTQRVLDDVVVTIAGDPKTPKVVAEPGQIKQVFINLIVNACDAMEGKGELEVTLSHGRFDTSFATVPLLGAEPGLDTGELPFTDYARRGIVFSSRIPYTEGDRIVMVHVRDVGAGIDPKKLDSVFEPFFTTKEKGKGTGLGLAICQRIVEGIGGILRLQSRPGVGTVASCFFMAESENTVGETEN
jgi:two-component system, NtrC family, sensor kinase